MNVKLQPHSVADGKIISHPGILGGKPVFAGTGVPVATLSEDLADGLSLDYFLESFPSVSRNLAAAVILHGESAIKHELNG